MKPPIIAAVLFAVLLGVVAYLAVSWWGTDSAPSEANPPPPPVLRDDAFVPLTAEAGRPRFVGELLGIFLAPSKDQFPPEVRGAMDRLAAGRCDYAPIEDAAAIAMPRQPELPSNLTPPASPIAVACGGVVTGMNYEYSGTSANGLPATVLIARSVAGGWGVDAARDRVSLSAVGGRQIIIVRPETADATGQTSQVIMPEPFGLTAIHAFNLNETELREVAAAVIAASQ